MDAKNVNRWVKEARLGEPGSPLQKGAEQEELARLRKEVKRLQMERDILKKAAAFFANECNGGMHL